MSAVAVLTQEQLFDMLELAAEKGAERALARGGAAMLTVDAAAEAAGVSAATIRRRIRSGEIVPVRLGPRSIRIPRDAVTRPGGPVAEEAHAARFPRPPSAE